MAVFPDRRIAGLDMRPSTAADLPFAAYLMETARAWERAHFGGDDTLWSMLMDQQARAQDHHYRTRYKDPTLDILERDGVRVGRLCLCEMSDEIRIMDIVLRPEARNHGLGRTIIREVQAAAAARGKAVRIHVEQFNPAQRLYERLGFHLLEDRGVHHFMEWRGDGERGMA